MTVEDAIFGLGAWLGAVRARLRAGEPAVPGVGDDDAMVADAAAFGAVQVYRLPGWKARQPAPMSMLDSYLIEIHALGKGCGGEEDFWLCMITYLPTPLPKAIAHDLIDRGLCILGLGHSNQFDEVWWRVADDVPEAVENLALRRYTDAGESVWRIEEVLHAFPWWEAIGAMLMRVAPEPPEKADWLAGQLRSRGLRALVEQRSRTAHPLFAKAWEASA